MKAFLVYLFWPNPGIWTYSDPKVAALSVVCASFIIVGIVFRFLRPKLRNPKTRSLSKTWSAAAVTLGIVGLVLIVSRVELIQFMAMRFLWVLWAGFLFLYVLLQFFLFRSRHYTVVAKAQIVDARDKYLPKKR